MLTSKSFLLGSLSLLASAVAYADPIDVAKAKQLAAPFVGADETPTLVKQANRSEAKSRTLSEKVKSTSPYYIFSRGENKGYVIVSGDDCLPEILGYTESGNFDEANLPPQLKGWLGYYAGLIEEAQIKGENRSRNSAAYMASAEQQLRTATERVDVPVLMTTHWHQTAPYNNNVPFMSGTTTRATTGCVATAGAQVVYYYHKDNPDSLLASTTPYCHDGQQAAVTATYLKGMPLKWGLMLDSYNGNRPQEYDDAVSTFTAALGAATRLMYGVGPGNSATSGQIADLVGTFKNYFRLSGECHYKNEGYSQTAWEKMIYEDLRAGHPLVYTGYNEESGGHAVVVDGYQASKNLFHFNFGWGGQGDGYFTVDDETGMNGFNSWQGFVYNVAPLKQNLAVTAELTQDAYISRTNTVKLRIKNNGTLDYSGIYLFANTTGKTPSSLTEAKSKDTETIFPATGDETTIELSFKPTTVNTWYVIVTDKNRNELAKITVDTSIPTSNLFLEDIAIDGNAENEVHSGKSYAVVYNDKASCTIKLRNESGINYEGIPSLKIFVSEDDGASFSQVGTKTVSIKIDANSCDKFSFNINNTTACPIEKGKLYRAELENPIKGLRTTDEINYTSDDTIVYFMLKDADLAVEKFEDGCLYLSGKWDPNLFTTLAKNAAYKTATTYDLTNVSGVNNVSGTENAPNALFYVADNSMAKGKNVVKKGAATCEELYLTAGAGFYPSQNFHAKKATINIAQVPNQWYLLTTPCAVKAPNGIIARRIDSHSGSGILNQTTNVTELEAGKTYLVMASSSVIQCLTGEDTEVVSAPGENVDAALVGTYTATTTPASSFLISAETNYFEKADEGSAVEPLRGYFTDSNMIGRFRAFSSLILDPRYAILGQNIESAYGILEDYRNTVTASAYKAFKDSIANAEQIFTEQSITSAQAVKTYADDLLAYAEVYKRNVVQGATGIRVDFTGLIENPSFELGNTNGWEVGASTARSVKVSSNLTYRGIGGEGDYLLYNFEKDSTSVALSQTITGLVPGTYELTAMLGSDYDNTVTMYAGEKKTTVTAHPFGRFYLTEAKIEDIDVDEGGTLEIGVEPGRWYKADNFRLICTSTKPGSTPDAIEDVTEVVPTEKTLIVKVINGGVCVTSTRQAYVSIYSVTGAKVYGKTIFGTENIALPSGIYIIAGKKVAIM